MGNQGVDPLLLNAWLSARSLARELSLPIPEYGGFRVDSNSDAEAARWVFPKMASGVKELARSINEPRYLIKVCGEAEELQAVLPIGWILHAPSYFMQATSNSAARRLAAGYRIETKRIGTVLEARIFSGTGALAASGYAAETQEPLSTTGS